MQDRIEREVVLKAPAERVYQAIADPTQIVKWFPDRVEGSLDKGSRPVFDFEGYGKVGLYVVAADPHTYFAYRWVPGETGSEEESVPADVLAVANTLVEFHLEPVAEGTKLRLVESGFSNLPSERIEKALSDNNSGWDYMLKRLAEMFEAA